MRVWGWGCNICNQSGVTKDENQPEAMNMIVDLRCFLLVGYIAGLRGKELTKMDRYSCAMRIQ